MKRRTWTIALMTLAVLVVGCGSSPVDGSSLEQTRWVLVMLGGESLVPDAAPTAEFSAGQISGSAGCNTYFGTYTVSGSEVTIGEVASTEMWCMEPEGVMDQEQTFLAALAPVASFRLAEERLELLDETGGVILMFEPRPAER